MTKADEDCRLAIHAGLREQRAHCLAVERAFNRRGRRGGRIGLGGGGAGTSPQVAKPSKLYALTGWSAANRYETAPGGGEAGQTSAAGGFGVATLFRLDALTAATEQLIARVAGNIGYTQIVESGTTPRAYFRTGSGQVGGPARVFTASDVGKIFLLVTRIDAANQNEAYVDRASRGVVAQSAYAPATGTETTVVGASSAGASPATGLSILGALAFRGAPTDAQLLAFYDAARLAGDIPKVLSGATVTHRWSVREQLRKNGGAIVDGQAAPAQLDDLVTGATVDALVKQGAGLVVREIDPASYDGRTSKGVLGFSATAFLQTAAGLGIRGSSEFVVLLEFIPTSIGGSEIEQYAITWNQDGPGGWELWRNGTALSVRVRDASGYVAAPSVTLTAADLNTVCFVALQVTAGNVRTLFASAGSELTDRGGTASTYVTAQASAPMRLGLGIQESIYPANKTVIRRLWGGNGTPSLATLQAAVASARAQAAIPIAGLTSGHFYDFTLDTAPSPDALPAQVLDRIGTDHLSRVDIDVPKVGPNGIRGVGPYAAGDVWMSPAGGGIRGSNEFAVLVDVVFSKVPSATEAIYSVNMANGNSGFFLQAISAALTATIGNVQNSAAYTITAADIGKRLRVLLRKTTTLLELWVRREDGAAAQVGGGTAAASYTTPSADLSFWIGAINGFGRNFGSGAIELVQGGDGAISPAQITAAFADMAAPPPLLASHKRWRFHDDTAATPSKTPRTSVERVAGNAADVLTRYGAGLQLAQRTERAWSYETSPIMKAGRASSGNRWEGTPTLETAPNTQGFFVAVMCRPNGATTGRLAAHANGGTVGWFVTCNAGVQLQFTVVDGTGANKQPPTISTTADGKVRCALWVYDLPSATLRAYHNRAQVSAGTSITSISTVNAGSLGLTLGSFYGGSSPCPDWDDFGLVYGLGAPTLAQFQAWEDATLALEDIVALDGATHMYSAKRGLVGGALKDLIGSYDLPAVGAPQIVDVYGRAFAR